MIILAITTIIRFITLLFIIIDAISSVSSEIFHVSDEQRGLTIADSCFHWQTFYESCNLSLFFHRGKLLKINISYYCPALQQKLLSVVISFQYSVYR